MSVKCKNKLVDVQGAARLSQKNSCFLRSWSTYIMAGYQVLGEVNTPKKMLIILRIFSSKNTQNWWFGWFLVIWAKFFTLNVFPSLSPPKRPKWGLGKKSKTIFLDRNSWRFRKKLRFFPWLFFDQTRLLKKMALKKNGS